MLIYVDGQEVEFYKTFNALIAFDISSAGEHSLEFKYSPDIYVKSGFISICGLLFFIAICVVDLTVFRKRKAKAAPLYWELEDFDRDQEERLGLPPAKKKTIKEKINSLRSKIGKKPKSPSVDCDVKPDENDTNTDEQGEN